LLHRQERRSAPLAAPGRGAVVKKPSSKGSRFRSHARGVPPTAYVNLQKNIKRIIGKATKDDERYAGFKIPLLGSWLRLRAVSRQLSSVVPHNRLVFEGARV